MRQLTHQERCTLLAALTYYAHGGQGEPKNRADEIQYLAEGTDERIGTETTTLDEFGIDQLFAKILNHETITVDGVIFRDFLDRPAMEFKYTDNPDGIGTIMPIAEWLECVKDGGFIDYDGFGHLIKNGYMDGKVRVRPSQAAAIPKDATHIMWYNR